jgi:hypothetical protein
VPAARPSPFSSLQIAHIEVRKTAFLQLGVKIKFETMQAIEEALFVSRKTKEKNAPSNEEPEELIRYAALMHNSVMTATSTEQ